MLRFTEETTGIKHIPKVLYHRMVHTESAGSPEKVESCAIDPAIKALEDRVTRLGGTGRVVARPFSPSYRIDRDVVGNPLVSIIIPSAGPVVTIRKQKIDILANCISEHSREIYLPQL